MNTTTKSDAERFEAVCAAAGGEAKWEAACGTRRSAEERCIAFDAALKQVQALENDDALTGALAELGDLRCKLAEMLLAAQDDYATADDVIHAAEHRSGECSCLHGPEARS